jgi:hypothetical protein
MKTFEGIKKTLRNLIQKHFAPDLGVFLSQQQQLQQQEKPFKVNEFFLSKVLITLREKTRVI